MNGEKLREYRKAAGLTQKELGEKCGISTVMVSYMEDEIKNPSVETLKRIIEVLGCTADELLS